MNWESVFTLQEKKAIISALGGIMQADKIVSETEKATLSIVAIKLGLSPQEMVEGVKMSPQNSLLILRNMSSNKKTEFSYMMGAMAMADGVLKDEEKALMIMIHTICEM